MLLRRDEYGVAIYACRNAACPQTGREVKEVYRVRHRIATLRGMIARWAPPSENDTGAYLRTVVRRSGVDPDAEIDTRDGPTMTRIAAAMARVENGVEPDEAEIAEGWRLFSADF